jgi:outer membrane protein OmpA-like peptidoglycan-associated protein
MYTLPGVFQQSADNDETPKYYITEGIHDHRIGLKYDFSQSKSGGLGAVVSVDIPVAQNDPYVGNDPKAIYNVELIYDHLRERDGFGLNIGYRKRPLGTPLPNAPLYMLGDQLIASAAYVYGLHTDQRVHAELFGAFPMGDSLYKEKKYASSLEALLALRHEFFTDFWGHLGGTVEVLPQGLSPDWRIYAGINYTFGGSGDNDRSSRDDSRVRPLRISPEVVELDAGGRESFMVTGGTPPYRYKLSEPVGAFSPSSGVYRAPMEYGTTNLIVTDDDGSSVEAFITVRGARPRASMPISDLTVEPSEVSMYPGSAQQFVPRGGRPPYSYRLSKRFGRFESDRQEYQAPTTTGSVQLLVADQAGGEVRVPITVVPLPKPNRELSLKNVNFIFNTAELTSESKTLLDNNLGQLKGVAIDKIIVVGHTDNKGSDQYNQRLSRLRAGTVAKAIAQTLGLASKQVDAIGYGEDQPIDTNETERGRLNNRRVELRVYYKK